MARPVNINGMVNDIMYKYDHNKNGAIDLKRPEKLMDRLKNPDERVRSTSNTYYTDDQLTVSTSVYTMRDLFYAADANNDGQVTREELTSGIKEFDKDGDGQMTSRGFWGWLTRKPKQEYDVFNAQFGERQTDYGNISLPLK